MNPKVLARRGRALAAPAVLACLIGAAPATAADAPFRAAPDIELGAGARSQPQPRAAAVGDFDSDGRQDLAIADSGLGVVHIRIGNGDGTFEPGASISGLTDARHVAVGDFDGDGIEDLAVAARRAKITDSVHVLRGNGDGTFAPHSSFALPADAAASSIAVGDFDADARADLAATSAGHVTVRQGQGDGRFAGGVNVPLADSAPASAVTGDFDGDGRDDIAVAITEGREIGVLRSSTDSDVSFDAVQRSPLPDDALTVAVGDFDEDGHLDAVAPLILKDRVAVRLGSGDTKLARDPGDVPVGAGPLGIAVGDFDGDGHEDFASANFGGGVSVRLGRGDGTFRDGGEAAAGRSTTALTAGDLDGDGAVDLAAMQGLHQVVGTLIGTSPAPLAGNLLINGGFEQGLGARLPGQQPAVPGWATDGGMTIARHGAHPHRGFPSWLDAARWSGGSNLLWGGAAGAAGATAATQVVDVAGSATAIDGGRATARLSAELGGALAVTDHMTATASFLNAGGAELGALSVGPVTAEPRRNQTTLLRREGSAPVPAGTRQVRVALRATAPAGGTSSALADNVRLALETQPATGGGDGPSGGADPQTPPPLPRCAGKPATIIGTPGADTLRGTRRADVIVALGGADRVLAAGRGDVVCGGAGRDRLSGGAGADRLLGGAGRDVLSGGAGRDRLEGGAARDRCLGGPGRDRSRGCEARR